MPDQTLMVFSTLPNSILNIRTESICYTSIKLVPANATKGNNADKQLSHSHYTLPCCSVLCTNTLNCIVPHNTI